MYITSLPKGRIKVRIGPFETIIESEEFPLKFGREFITTSKRIIRISDLKDIAKR